MNIEKVFGDMSSIMWTCLLGGRADDAVPVEHGGRTVYVNSAMHGYEKVVERVNETLEAYKLTPKDFVMVFEGKDSKQRRVLIDNTYKANREGDKDGRPPEAYEQFYILRELIRETYHNLGSVACMQNGVEGDDVLAYLAKNTEVDAVIYTHDNDLIVLNQINDYGSKIMVRIGTEVGANKYGDFSFKLVTLYKALVGDSSDNIKGCPGFGTGAWLNLIGNYDEDGAEEVERLLRQGRRDELAVFADSNKDKGLQKIVDNWDQVVRCLKLTTLYPEWVDTARVSLQWVAGIVLNKTDDERLQKWRARQRLVTADNYEDSLARLVSNLGRTPYIGFDIESSSVEESDDWIEAQGKKDGVDPLGHRLTGFSMTFGDNLQHTYYVSVNHADTNNITMLQARKMIEAAFGKDFIIANSSFELSVLTNSAKDEDGTLWSDHWKQYGEEGFIPNVRDVQLEASYVNENVKLGLKFRAALHIGYEQTSYEEVTENSKYKMCDLTGQQVLSYGADDAITAAHLHNFYKFHMELEHHYKVYEQVELAANYQHVQNYLRGIKISSARLSELIKEDDKTYNDSWAIVRAYLISQGWDGTVPPTYSKEITAKEIKEAYRIVMGKLETDSPDEDEDVSDAEDDDGDSEDETSAEPVVQEKDPILSSRVRIPAKFIPMLQAEGHDELAFYVETAIGGDPQKLTDYVRRHFKGEPSFKFSNRVMCRLLYESMGLPIKVRNKPTPKMKAEGIRQGNPKGDALALAYAVRDAGDDLKPVLESLKLMQMVRTRRSLYYNNYPGFVHWQDGKVHSSHRQSSTNTRRASSAKPNVQQMPKHPKVEGYDSQFRSIVLPHRSDAVVVSMDFSAQELRVIADFSQDENMLACYVGDKGSKKDMHILTGMGIIRFKEPALVKTALDALSDEERELEKDKREYLAFLALKTIGQQAVYDKYRALGKKVNFTTEYGAQAPKLAATLLVDEDEAQAYIDAREDAFPRAKEWKQEVVAEAKKKGYVTTKLGARRHLAQLLQSPDRFIASKAERQAVNFKIQSSSAEQTKLAEGAMWKQKLFTRFDAVCYGPIHDEVVASVRICDLVEFLPLMHACMVQAYADMGVPIVSEISFGPNFKKQIEIGELPTPEAIAKGVTKLRELQTA